MALPPVSETSKKPPLPLGPAPLARRGLRCNLLPPIYGCMTPLALLFSLPVRTYRLVFSPWVGFNCRYQPTCSAYALEALAEHGAIKGAWLILRRLGRCHPLGGDGYDPVPGTDPDHDRRKKECSCR